MTVDIWCIHNRFYVKYVRRDVIFTKRISKKTYEVFKGTTEYKCNGHRDTVHTDSVIDHNEDVIKDRLSIRSCNNPYSKGGINKKDLRLLASKYKIKLRAGALKSEICKLLIGKIESTDIKTLDANIDRVERDLGEYKDLEVENKKLLVLIADSDRSSVQQENDKKLLLANIHELKELKETHLLLLDSIQKENIGLKEKIAYMKTLDIESINKYELKISTLRNMLESKNSEVKRIYVLIDSIKQKNKECINDLNSYKNDLSIKNKQLIVSLQDASRNIELKDKDRLDLISNVQKIEKVNALLTQKVANKDLELKKQLKSKDETLLLLNSQFKKSIQAELGDTIQALKRGKEELERNNSKLNESYSMLSQQCTRMDSKYKLEKSNLQREFNKLATLLADHKTKCFQDKENAYKITKFLELKLTATIRKLKRSKNKLIQNNSDVLEARKLACTKDIKGLSVVNESLGLNLKTLSLNNNALKNKNSKLARLYTALIQKLEDHKTKCFQDKEKASKLSRTIEIKLGATIKKLGRGNKTLENTLARNLEESIKLKTSLNNTISTLTQNNDQLKTDNADIANKIYTLSKQLDNSKDVKIKQMYRSIANLTDYKSRTDKKVGILTLKIRECEAKDEKLTRSIIITKEQFSKDLDILKTYKREADKNIQLLTNAKNALRETLSNERGRYETIGSTLRKAIGETRMQNSILETKKNALTKTLSTVRSQYETRNETLRADIRKNKQIMSGIESDFKNSIIKNKQITDAIEDDLKNKIGKLSMDVVVYKKINAASNAVIQEYKIKLRDASVTGNDLKSTLVALRRTSENLKKCKEQSLIAIEELKKFNSNTTELLQSQVQTLENFVRGEASKNRELQATIISLTDSLREMKAINVSNAVILETERARIPETTRVELEAKMIKHKEILRLKDAEIRRLTRDIKERTNRLDKLSKYTKLEEEYENVKRQLRECLTKGKKSEACCKNKSEYDTQVLETAKTFSVYLSLWWSYGNKFIMGESEEARLLNKLYTLPDHDVKQILNNIDQIFNLEIEGNNNLSVHTEVNDNTYKKLTNFLHAYKDIKEVFQRWNYKKKGASKMKLELDKLISDTTKVNIKPDIVLGKMSEILKRSREHKEDILPEDEAELPEDEAEDEDEEEDSYEDSEDEDEDEDEDDEEDDDEEDDDEDDDEDDEDRY